MVIRLRIVIVDKDIACCLQRVHIPFPTVSIHNLTISGFMLAMSILFQRKKPERDEESLREKLMCTCLLLTSVLQPYPLITKLRVPICFHYFLPISSVSLNRTNMML